jgi:hypothetical protein
LWDQDTGMRCMVRGDLPSSVGGPGFRSGGGCDLRAMPLVL